jgi:GT2 family glycosyltransferase/glycosyltransferase involved in cell wall biosynthesis
MDRHPVKKQSELVVALRKELDARERELTYHKWVLENFLQSPAWRWTAPIRWVANRFRNLGRSAPSNLPDTMPKVDRAEESPFTWGARRYFTGLCRISLENFNTGGATLELPLYDDPEISKVLKEIAAREKEIEDQQWVFERFLQSPAWRWTAPIRWVASRVPGLSNGHHSIPPVKPASSEGEGPETNSILETKAYFTELCRVALNDFLTSGATLDVPRSDNPRLSIILVLFNRAELTLACLRSIAANHGEDCEVVIVDNNSTDETGQVLEHVHGAHIIRNSTNRHFLAAANQAARECRGEYLLLLNNDAQLLPGAVQSALGTLQSSPNIGAVGGRIILLDGTLQEAGSIVWKDGSCVGYGRGDQPFAPMYSFRRDVDYCSGAFLLTPRKIWEELGGFDHTFEPAYYEETDYCMRLWERGLRVVYEPSAAIIHYEFASSQSSASAISLQTRNRNVFAERHGAALERHESAGTGNIIRARSANCQRRILCVDDRVPHLWLGSGFPRANALHRTLQRMGYFVTLYPIDVINEPWEQAYSDFPREVEVMLGMGRQMLEAFLRNRRDYYSTIIVSRPHNMQLMATVRTAHPDWFENVEVIYDAEALFAEREVGLRKLAGKPMSDQEVRAALASEIRLTVAADCVVTVSEVERQAFLIHGIRRVEVLGHSIEPSPGDAPFDAREGLLFVGAVHNDASPNADSLIWFLSDVFPRIRKTLGDIPVIIAGLNQSKRIRAMALPPVRITGHLPSLDELYLKSRVFIAPTRYGAGIPHKVHEAAAHGLPVVATPLLGRQLGWSDRELAIGKDAGSFAEACVQIYTDRSRWKGLREAALERVRKECSLHIFEDAVRRILLGEEPDPQSVR